MSVPFDFYKATLELWSQMTKEAQSSSQQWLEQAAKVANEDLAQTQARMQQCVEEKNWLALAGLPQEAAWRTSQHQMQVWQTAVQTVLQQQPHFSEGMQKALAGWQEDAIKSFGQAWTQAGNPAAYLRAFSVCR